MTEKEGRTGQLVFVKVRHEMRCNGSGRAGDRRVPRHRLPRSASGPTTSSRRRKPRRTGAAWQREIVPDDVLLFRYSALTFNGHRIHYDRKYVTEVEGYPGLIVHGPLIATLLMDLLRRKLPDAEVASVPLQGGAADLRPQPVLASTAQPQADGKTVKLWAQDHEGWLTMDATAAFAEGACTCNLSKDITVVTLEHAIAAPFATRQLADLGARVIKIERPGVGDFARGYDERVRGLASHFVWTNRSKESLTLDVKHPEAAEHARSAWCSNKADVVVQNLAPGAAARLGLGYEALAAREARRSSSATSPATATTGPYRDKKAYDLLIQSEAGLRLGHRHAGRAVQGRPVDRRHRRRHVRLHQHPRGAAAARSRPAAASTSTSRCWSRWSNG